MILSDFKIELYENERLKEVVKNLPADTGIEVSYVGKIVERLKSNSDSYNFELEDADLYKKSGFLMENIYDDHLLKSYLILPEPNERRVSTTVKLYAGDVRFTDRCYIAEPPLAQEVIYINEFPNKDWIPQVVDMTELNSILGQPGTGKIYFAYDPEKVKNYGGLLRYLGKDRKTRAELLDCQPILAKIAGGKDESAQVVFYQSKETVVSRKQAKEDFVKIRIYEPKKLGDEKILAKSNKIMQK